MAKQVYWLSDAEWRRIEPLLPRGRKGAHRVDDRRVISGIMHMLKSGSRWRDCPEVYGPYTTVYNRFNRWSRQGLWLQMFEALTGHSGIFDGAAIDEEERARELELARFDQERIDDLVRRQQRWADRSWRPPPQGGAKRAGDDEDDGG